MPRHSRLIATLSTLVLLLAACNQNGVDEEVADDPNGTGETDTGTAPTRAPLRAEETVDLADGTTANFVGEVNVIDESSIEFSLDDNYFEPTTLIGMAGEEFMLEALNRGDNIHNFSIEAVIDQDFRRGEQLDLKVWFPQTGAVTFFCKYHADLGMRGELRISP